MPYEQGLMGAQLAQMAPGQPNDPSPDQRFKIPIYVMISLSIALHSIWLIILLLSIYGFLSVLDDKVPEPDPEHPIQPIKALSNLLITFLFVDTICSIGYDVCGLVTVYTVKYTHMLLYTVCAFVVMLISFALLGSTGFAVYFVSGLFYLSIVCLMILHIYPMYRDRAQDGI